MRLGVFSDVHGNLDALEVVLKRVAEASVDRLWCLGDTIGYGGQPGECAERVLNLADCVLAGNHDRALENLDHLKSASTVARQGIEHARSRLDASLTAQLSALPNIVVDEGSGTIGVHGSFLNPDFYWGYITPTTLEDNLEALRAAGRPAVAFCGHTHQPWIAWRVGRQIERHNSPVGSVQWPRKAEQVLINVGAVGQPRDGDARSCFAIVDTVACAAHFVRTPYPVEQAARAITRAGLHKSLAARLAVGR